MHYESPCPNLHWTVVLPELVEFGNHTRRALTTCSPLTQLYLAELDVDVRITFVVHGVGIADDVGFCNRVSSLDCKGVDKDCVDVENEQSNPTAAPMQGRARLNALIGSRSRDLQRLRLRGPLFFLMAIRQTNVSAPPE